MLCAGRALLVHQLHHFFKGHKFIVFLLQHFDDSFDPSAIGTNSPLRVYLIVQFQISQNRHFLLGQFKGMQIKYIVIVVVDVVGNQGFDKAPIAQPDIATAGNREGPSEDLFPGQAEFVEILVPENAIAEHFEFVQIQLDSMSGC